MTSETTSLKGMYFQLVESQVLSAQGQPDVNLHRLTVLAKTRFHFHAPVHGVVRAGAIRVLRRKRLKRTAQKDLIQELSRCRGAG